MAISPVLPPAKVASDPHQRLSETHQEASSLARSLNASLALTLEMDLPDARSKVIQIGDALQKVASAERACGGCSGQDHTFAKAYMEMLQHHRRAYLDFERVARELTNNHLPSRSDVARLAADLEHHLEASETAHQASLRSQKPTEVATSYQVSVQM